MTTGTGAENGMYRAIIVDDQPVFRNIIRTLLENAGDFEVVGEATDGDEALAMFMATQPDLVMMDVQMERVNGFEATSRLVAHDSTAAVVLTSMSQDPEYSMLAAEAGAIGFFSKRTLEIEGVRRVLLRSRETGSAAA